MNLVFGFTDTIPTQTKYMYISLDVLADFVFFFFCRYATASGRSDGLFYYVVEESPLARYGLSFKYTLSYIIDYF
uniref:Uncharacterized protein n=1 Tax=Helianthus annuus TaxID=4232 RepID=A0A251TUI5_HELAN